MRRRILCVLLAAAAVGCYGAMLIRLRDYEGAYRVVTAKLSAPCTVRDARQALEAFPDADYALYAQKNKQTASSEAFGRSADVTVISLAGNPKNFAHLPVNGYLPASAADGLCAVDRETALRLWGSADARGLTLHYGDENYIVCGILDVDAPLLCLAPAEDMPIDRLALSGADGYDMARRLGESLGGIEAVYVDEEGCAWLRLLLYLAPLAALVAAAAKLRGQIPGGNLIARRARRALLPCVTAIAVCAAAALAIQAVPIRALPNRWSDFAAYASLIKNAASPFGDAASLRGEWLRADALAYLTLGAASCAAACVCIGLYPVRACVTIPSSS